MTGEVGHDRLMDEVNIVERKIPVEPSLAEELIGFWETIFGRSFAELRSVLAGEEHGQNCDLLFLVREGRRFVGTCLLTFPTANPEVGGLGEVMVDPEFRRRGIATALCARAREVFRYHGGKALFLGTTAPNAARVYGRLGWRTLPGTHVMLLTFGPQSPEEWLEDHFRQTTPVVVASATAADRTAMIPLLVSSHDWCVLDANVRVFSTRYVTQDSCMGLYPRYQAIREDKRGNWFVAHANNGCVVGLSTVRLNEQGRATVDGFAHRHYISCVGSLIDAAMRWGAENGASELEAIISEDDGAKLAQFELAGFRTVATADPFELEGRKVPAVCLKKPVATREFAPMH